MNRERLDIFPLLLIVTGFILEVASVPVGFFLGAGKEVFCLGISLMLLGVTASVSANALQRQAARIDTLERQLKESDGEMEALRESLRARVGALERQLDELRAAAPTAPKP
jgi:hypothetical protein